MFLPASQRMTSPSVLVDRQARDIALIESWNAKWFHADALLPSAPWKAAAAYQTWKAKRCHFIVPVFFLTSVKFMRYKKIRRFVAHIY
jgi:hypothetical protein